MTTDWATFLQDAKQFVELSRRIGDDWTLEERNNQDGYTYLKFKQKLRFTYNSGVCDETNELPEEHVAVDESLAVPNREEVFSIEYHVVYSISYQVPVLYFKGYRSDGTLISIDDAWEIFRKHSRMCSDSDSDDMLKILTQMDHPVLCKPYMALHPCRTHEVLGQMPESKNRILTFLSVYGPYVALNLSNEYGLYVGN